MEEIVHSLCQHSISQHLIFDMKDTMVFCSKRESESVIEIFCLGKWDVVRKLVTSLCQFLYPESTHIVTRYSPTCSNYVYMQHMKVMHSLTRGVLPTLELDIRSAVTLLFLDIPSRDQNALPVIRSHCQYFDVGFPGALTTSVNGDYLVASKGELFKLKCNKKLLIKSIKTKFSVLTGSRCVRDEVLISFLDFVMHQQDAMKAWF